MRGRFLLLAWPQLLLMAVYGLTLVRVARIRLLATPEGALELSNQAVWGMVGFATLPVLMGLGILYAAWQARRPPSDGPWESVDVRQIGGDET